MVLSNDIGLAITIAYFSIVTYAIRLLRAADL